MSLSYADETHQTLRVNLFETSSPCGPDSSPFAYLDARSDFGVHVAALSSAQTEGRPVTLLVQHLAECCHILEWSLDPWHQVGLPAHRLKAAGAALHKTSEYAGTRVCEPADLPS